MPSPAQPVTVPASRQADRVAIIPIHEPIDKVTAFSVKRRMELAIAGGAQALVFDINTPGGEVPSVLEICSAIKSSSVPNTVAWIHPQAYSGGAIIALACREIVVADGAAMGDALPIRIGPGGVDVATQGELRKKQVPPVLAEVVDSSRLRGWDEFIVQAIVIDRVADALSGSGAATGLAGDCRCQQRGAVRDDARFGAPSGRASGARE